MRVHQCPRCECRFPDEWELEDHMQADHGVDRLNHVSDTARRDPSPH